MGIFRGMFMFQAFLLGKYSKKSILLLFLSGLIFEGGLLAAPRKVSFTDHTFYYELGYQALLFWGGPKLANGLKRPEGEGIQRMPWQAFDDRMRELLHPYDYADGPLSKEKHWNTNAGLFSKSLIYPTLVAPFFKYSSDEWLGSFLTIAHCIETSFHASRALRAMVGRYRPRVIYRDEIVLDDEKKNSFPSGHAGEAFAWATTAVLVLDLPLYWQVAAFGAASFASLGRIPGGQHYFTDLVAGAVVGTGFSYLAYELSMGMVIPQNREEKSVHYSIGPNYFQLTYDF